MTDAAQQMSNVPDAGKEALTDALRVSFRLLMYTIVLLAVGYLLSGIFIVQEHQRAYVLVLGKITGVGSDRVKGPGLHWTWPKPFSEIVRVPAERIQTIEARSAWYEDERGFHAEHHTAQHTSPVLRPGQDGYLLTGDANILHAQWGVRYTIRDPEIYLFAVADPLTLLHKELDRASALVAQQWPVDRALRSDLEGFRAAVDQVLRRRLDELATGLHLHRLDLLAIAPPRQVETAFEAVIEAEQDRSRSVSAARAYAARLLNETKGEEGRIRSQAMAQRQRIISEAAGDADYFRSVLETYRQYPEVITASLWQDRIRTILSRVDAHYIVHKREDGTQELRLQLGAPPR